MAFRREIFARVGGFDPALDVGTATDGGGDLEFFFRVVQEGYTLLYEPAALVRHQHRRDRAALTRQIAGWGTGFLAYVARSWRAYPRERLRFARMLGWWHLRWILRRGLQGLCAPGRHSPKLALTELGGALRGAARYRRARRRAEEIALVHGASKPPLRGSGGRASRPRTAIITRSVELDAPLAAISVPCAAAVRVVASWRGRPLASALIPTGGDRLAAPRIYQELAQQLAARLHGRERWQGERAWSCLYGALLGAPAPRPERRLADAISVSIVIATRDRPELLRRCLRSLLEQHTRRRVQFVVVDNHPASGLTARAVREFPGVRLVSEARAGLSYARNAGIAASDGEIVVATDDDVTAPPEWLERLLGPFAREEVAIVTGNVLPEELETEAQSWFERYGGLGRGWQPFEVGADWLASLRGRPVPTWSLGATANAAFRASLFADPRVGLLDEGLGPGTPTGCGEDTYLFYRALRAGHTLVYEPTAYVWHRHRRSMRELRSQLYQYSKGHVAYHLTTWLRDGERGAWPRLLRELPRWQLREYTRWFGSYCPHPLRRWLGGYEAFPLSLLLAELCGSLAGPWALCRSRLRVRWLGRSEPLCPAAGPAAARPRDRRRRAGGVRASG
jgi:GT2 family glycosyltransferase